MIDHALLVANKDIKKGLVQRKDIAQVVSKRVIKLRNASIRILLVMYVRRKGTLHDFVQSLQEEYTLL